jgi:hypothetical protein
MKNITLSLLFILPFCLYSQSNQGLNFESTDFDFGNVSSGSKALATFLFTNESSKYVEILKIHGGNHCLEIDSTSLKSYAPKEKGIITATYNTDCIGPIRKTLSVFTTSKDNTITLKLLGEVSEK